MFSVVNDEGKADIDIVSQDAINKNMNKVESAKPMGVYYLEIW
jgi:hypothetical protein